MRAQCTTRSRVLRQLLALATLALSAAACGASAPASTHLLARFNTVEPPERIEVKQAHYLAGERFSFELSLKGIVGAEATLVVGRPGLVDDKRVIIVRSRVASSGVVAFFKEVRDDVTSWIDLDSGRPLSHFADVRFGEKESVIETKFNGGEPGDFSIAYERKGRGSRILKQHMPAGEAAYDAHAVLGALRAWRVAEGMHAYFYVIAGRRLWRNTIRLTTRETIKTSLGVFPAIRIDGVARRLRYDASEDTRKQPRRFSIWLTDDKDRLPVLVTAATEYGDVRVELSAYSRDEQRVSFR